MQFSVFVLPAAAAAIITFGLTLMSQRQSRRIEIPAFYGVTLGVMLWSIANMLEYAVIDLNAKIFWVNIKYIGIGLSLAMWLAFALQYTGYGHLLTRRVWALLAIEPLLVIILGFTNDSHLLLRQSIFLKTVGSFTYLDYVPGPAFWLNFIYAYTLMLSSTVLIVRTFRRPTEANTGMTVGLLVSVLTPWLANLIYILGITPIDLTTLGFVQIAMVIVWGGYRLQPGKLSHTARDMIVENMRDGVLVLDIEKRVVDMNRAAGSILGIGEAEGLGQTIGELFARQPHLVKQLEAVTASRRDIMLETTQGIRFYEITFAPMYDPQRQIVGQIVMFYDITERQKALEAQRENQSRLRLTLNQLPAVLWTTDLDLKMTSVTGSVLESIDMEASKVLGRSMYEIFDAHSPTDPAIAAHLQALAGESGKYIYEHKGSLFEVHVEPLRNYDREIMGGLSIALDVTKRREAERRELELVAERERVRALSEFIRDISHDFKTPLSTINASLYLVERLDDLEKRTFHAKTIKQQTARLSNLLEDMLTMLRLDTGMELSLRLVDINQLADDVYTLILPAAQAKGLECTLEKTPDLPAAMLDRTQMLLALNKIAENARLYTAPGGKITISTRQQGEGLVLAIQDTGIGMVKEDIEQIFSRFYRADKARSTETGGVGLGLSVARKIVEVHGGAIEVESTLGVGSTFHILLPAISTKVSPGAT